MTDKQKVKKIDLRQLEQIEQKAASKKLKKTGIMILLLLLLGIGGLAVHWVMGDNVLASRMAINKMTCPGCIITLKEVTGKIPGVIEADVSLAAQELTVKFYEKKTTPEEIRSAIVHAGYPARADGLFKPSAKGIDDVIIATVNGDPVFQKDISSSESSPMASELFSAIGKRILLQIADEKQIVVQPHEIEKEIRLLANNQGVSVRKIIDKGIQRFGSVEKYIQAIGQSIGIRKLLNNDIFTQVSEDTEKDREKTEWLAECFMKADVKFLDSKTKERLGTETGQNEWQQFWPLMISRDTELKRILSQTS